MIPNDHYKPAAELVKLAETLRISQSGLPMEAVQGYPVPVRYDGKVALAFPFFNIRGKPPASPEVMPPRSIMYIDAITGDLLATVERKDDFSKSLGRHEMGKMTVAELLEKQQRIFKLYDTLIPIAFGGAPHTKEIPRDIEELRRLWQQVAHKPLARFYQELSPSWCAFIDLH